MRATPTLGRENAAAMAQLSGRMSMPCGRLPGAQTGDRRTAFAELSLLTDKVCRDGHFAEIYHPDTGERYGGGKEATSIKNYKTWDSECPANVVRYWLYSDDS